MHSFPLWFEVVMYVLIHPWLLVLIAGALAVVIWFVVLQIKARRARKKLGQLANLPVVVMPPDTRSGDDNIS